MLPYGVLSYAFIWDEMEAPQALQPQQQAVAQPEVGGTVNTASTTMHRARSPCCQSHSGQ